MSENMQEQQWDKLSYAEKNQILFKKQKAMLKTFLKKNAISKEQYEQSLNGLIEKIDL